MDILRTRNISNGAPAAHVNNVARPAAAKNRNSFGPDEASSLKKTALNDRRNSSVAPNPNSPNTAREAMSEVYVHQDEQVNNNLLTNGRDKGDISTLEE